jgi:hypothetical protein
MLELLSSHGLLHWVQVHPLTRRKRFVLKVSSVGTDFTVMVAGKDSPAVPMENMYGLLNVLLTRGAPIMVPVRQRNPGRDSGHVVVLTITGGSPTVRLLEQAAAQKQEA